MIVELKWNCVRIVQDESLRRSLLLVGVKGRIPVINEKLAYESIDG